MQLRPQRVLVALAAIFAAIVIVRSVTPAAPPSPPPPPPEELAALAGTITLPPELSFLQTPRQVPTPNPLGTWRPVFQQSGLENAQTSTFELTGSLVRVRYSLTGEVSVLAVYVLPDAPTPPAFGFPDVITAGAGGGENFLPRAAGTYYLSVQSVGGTWTIEIEEEVVPSEEPAASIGEG